ncbi:MAG: hypothetical protein PHW83_00105 [Bacteroidales bacterium]|nr:hypothetical protein [Bacteroidales bacterium]
MILLFELMIIFIALIAMLFAYKKANLLLLFISSLLVGFAFVLVDFVFNQVKYDTLINMPILNIPIVIVIIIAFYFTIMVLLKDLIKRKFIKAIGLLNIVFDFIILFLLNFSYFTVDYFIVVSGFCVFKDDNIQNGYNNFYLSEMPLQYMIFAFFYFYLGLIFVSVIFSLLKNMRLKH